MTTNSTKIAHEFKNLLDDGVIRDSLKICIKRQS